MSKKPLLGITMGDPAGVGPEIVVKCLAERKVHDLCVPLVVGDPEVMRRAAEEIVQSGQTVRVIARASEASGRTDIVDVLPLDGPAVGDFELGQVNARCGDAAFRSVKKAIELALAGEIDGTVTSPINKEAMNLAGHHYDGHTEIYAELTNTRDYTMMLADGGMRVCHVTTHVAMEKVPALITRDRVLAVIRLAHAVCLKLGVAEPRIAVAGYNPHAGENGLFGRQEIEQIKPAIADARAEGMDVSDPVPPDTVFCKAVGGMYDMVIAMYHDQGHIPMKLLSFKYDETTGTWSGMTGVNITLGLPIVRSSVDHGTAFDKAGKGTASPRSLIDAIEYGARLSGDKK